MALTRATSVFNKVVHSDVFVFCTANIISGDLGNSPIQGCMQAILVPGWSQEEAHGERSAAELCQSQEVRRPSEWRSLQNWDFSVFKTGFPLLLCQLNATALHRQKVEFWKRCDCFFYIVYKLQSNFSLVLSLPFSSSPSFFSPFFCVFFSFSLSFFFSVWDFQSCSLQTTVERLLYSSYAYIFTLIVSTADWESLFHPPYTKSWHQPQGLHDNFWLAKDIFRALTSLRFLYIIFDSIFNILNSCRLTL